MKTINQLLELNADFQTLYKTILDDCIEYCRDEYDGQKEDFLNDSQFGLDGMINEYRNDITKLFNHIPTFIWNDCSCIEKSLKEDFLNSKE